MRTNRNDLHDQRNREVVQQSKGLRLHSAGRRSKDVFVHISAVERAGLSTLNEGQKVSFEVVANRRTGKSAAENLQAA
jgi:CspA family cold shock protein